MRIRDIEKQNAVIKATIKVINEIGFASASISKIAKEAGVSVGTIYIYYQNKEDLVVSVYYYVKEKMTVVLFNGMSENNSVKKNLKILWDNTINSGTIIPELIAYSEQFLNSPFYDLIDTVKIDEITKPVMGIVNRGIEEKILKQISFEVFIAFFYVPANFLSNRKICPGFEITEQNINDTFQLVWSTIKK